MYVCISQNIDVLITVKRMKTKFTILFKCIIIICLMTGSNRRRTAVKATTYTSDLKHSDLCQTLSFNLSFNTVSQTKLILTVLNF